MRLILIFISILLSSQLCHAGLESDSDVEIGIEEKLGNLVPLNLTVTDENGKQVLLSDFVNKPTILTLVYYRCPGICSPLLEGLTKAVDRLKWQAGKDYNVLTLSFDPTETTDLARQKKDNYLKTMKNPPAEESWKWVTADSDTIAKITEATGFRYKKEGKDYVHSATLMVLSAEGKLCRYLYGISFLPFDLQMALTEAQAGKIGPTIAKLLKFCFSYDPQAKKYVLQVTRIIGTVMLFCLGIFLVFLVYGGKPKPSKEEGKV